MSFRDKAIFLELLALAWDSPEPGVIALPMEQIAKEVGVTPATLRHHVRAFPTTATRRADGALVIPRLHEQFIKYQEISEIRRRAASKCLANAQHEPLSASASASASTSQDHKAYKSSSNGLDDLKKSFLSKCQDPEGQIAAMVEIVCMRAARSGTEIKTEAYIAKAVEGFDTQGGPDREELLQFMRGRVH